MRPVRLAVEGFTAFRQAQEIDLEPLDLFAIVGPTGSGKSSLLDAMTYALYGRVARVEDTQTPVRQLVSHGLPWMKVMLDFKVSGERYRVTRRTPTGPGGAKVLLERFVDGIPRQYGEGADRVTEVNRIVQRLVGLDYDGFTRSVLLPQGKFAELLNGKAEDRRRLLNDLLDLWLFERLGKRARRMADEASFKAAAHQEHIERTYAAATAEALKDGRDAARAAEGREAALDKLVAELDDLAERWTFLDRSATELGRLATDGARVAAMVQGVAQRLDGLAQRLSEAEMALTHSDQAVHQARSDARAATAARQEAEREWGTVPDLTAAHAKAERLALLERELTRRRRRLDEERAAIPRFEEGVRSREADLRASADALRAAEEELQHARHEEKVAEDADRIAALVAGAKAGDPCPVCGLPLDRVPDPPGAQAVAEATAVRERREKALAAARTAVERNARLVDDARNDLRSHEREAERLEEWTSEITEDLAAVQDETKRALGTALPDDPLAVLADRIRRLQDLAAAESQAARRLAEASEVHAGADRERAALLSEVQGEAARLEVDISALLERARSEADDDFAPLPSPPTSPDPTVVRDYASSLGAALEDLVRRLRQLHEERRARRDEVVAAARTAAAGLLSSDDTLPDLRRAAFDARVQVREERVRLQARAEDLERAVEERARLAAEVKNLQLRSTRFTTLAAELRANRIIDFLQGEALRMLSLAGSRHLEVLSRGRYRLDYEGDEFYVLDAENADERRSVRTLSGGETFLASLSLALALSEEVRSLSVTEKAPLDSLFLDEGFGTLDPETLEDVAQAIEQLGNDGRLVAIVTHVRELADRLPVRLEVAKSPRGSRVTVVS